MKEVVGGSGNWWGKDYEEDGATLLPALCVHMWISKHTHRGMGGTGLIMKTLYNDKVL